MEEATTQHGMQRMNLATGYHPSNLFEFKHDIGLNVSYIKKTILSALGYNSGSKGAQEGRNGGTSSGSKIDLLKKTGKRAFNKN